MRKPVSRTMFALLVALAAGIATAALQPGATPETSGIAAAKAVAERLTLAVKAHAATS